MNSKSIVFIKTIPGLPDLFLPEPAEKNIPDWYKATPSYYPNKTVISAGSTPATVKKCMPFFDSLTAGYILFTHCDIQVTKQDDAPYYLWSNYNAISFHPITQAHLYPDAPSDLPIAKWMSPWGIKTPKGFSTLFTQPYHRESPFRVLPGIVDTDVYTDAVNVIFVLKDPDFVGIIPAGTPIVQVIPFKRDSWKMRIEEDPTESLLVRNKRNSYFLNSYKRLFWNKKEYK